MTKRNEIFFDAAPLKNGRYHNGFKWAATDREGGLIAEGVNTRAEWQIEGEAFGLLRVVEYIEQNRQDFADKVTIYGDNGTVMGLKFKSKTMAGKYCYIAQTKAKNLVGKLVDECSDLTEVMSSRISIHFYGGEGLKKGELFPHVAEILEHTDDFW